MYSSSRGILYTAPPAPTDDESRTQTTSKAENAAEADERVPATPASGETESAVSELAEEPLAADD